jgi:hypothetical protein
MDSGINKALLKLLSSSVKIEGIPNDDTSLPCSYNIHITGDGGSISGSIAFMQLIDDLQKKGSAVNVYCDGSAMTAGFNRPVQINS